MTSSPAVTDTVAVPVVSLDAVDAMRSAQFGHKASTLALLRREGFPVPPGFVIPVGAVPSHRDVESALACLGPGPVAVRSSGTVEDGEQATWAGQYDTFLNVDGVDDVLQAIDACQASGRSRRARDYAQLHGGGGDVAVLVQRMVPATTAGVAFTANPITGDLNEILISAAVGLGNRLVSGEVVADEWRVVGDRTTAIATPHDCLTTQLVLAIAELARRVEVARGCPQDIEFACVGEEVLLLQARPIVDLPIEPDRTPPPGNWTKDTAHFPEPVTPLGETAYVALFGDTVSSMFAEWGLMPERMESRCIGYESYSRFLPEGGSPPPWWLLAIVARIVPSIRRKLATAAAVEASGKLEAVAASWERTLRPQLDARISALRDLTLTAFTDDALVAHLDGVVVLCDEAQRIHFQLMIPYMVGLHDLFLLVSRHLGWDDLQTMSLVQGLSSASSAPTTELRDVAVAVAQRPGARAVVEQARPSFVEELEDIDPPIAERLRTWLHRWGFRTTGYDPGLPSLAEQPHRVAELLRDLLDAPQPVDLEQRRRQCVATARESLPREVHGEFDAALAFAEAVYPIREDNIVYTDSLPGGLVRRGALEVGRRLVERGQLRHATDVAYLRLDELRAFPTLDHDMTGVADRRRREMAWVRMHPGPMVLGRTEPPPPDIRGLPAPARRLNGAILWAMAAEMVAPTPPKNDGTLAGIGASAGTYEGVVRVIRDAANLHRLRRGEVLVCAITTPAWAVYFSRAAALITDGGSVLSHAAIIAREHGIPAVVATGAATTRLTDGMRVRVDGAKGEVTVIG